MPDTTLTIIAWISLLAAFTCSILIIIDVFVRGYRQEMSIMEWVWPVTALYTGPIGVYFYYKYGIQSSNKWQSEHKKSDYGRAISVGIGVSHCGAGCTLGDIIGATSVFLIGWKIAGLALWPEYIVDFSLAFMFGAIFQYFAIAPMRGLGIKDGLIAALQADTFSLLSFEIGLFGWMALMQLVFFSVGHLHPDTAVYWFLMQVGMIIGFATAYPVNILLIRLGIKEAM